MPDKGPVSDQHPEKANAKPPGDKPTEVSRRDFLKQTTAGAVALAATGMGINGLFKPQPVYQIQESTGFIMPDPTLCIGCLTCEVICSQVHREQGLSDVPRIRIYFDDKITVDPAITEAYPDRGQFHQSPCLMCPDAPCHYVCPVNALPIEPTTGARIIDEDKCIACGRCTEACPFPTSQESEAASDLGIIQTSRITFDPAKNVYTKCDLCYWRPEGPACVERCPVNVRIRQGLIESDNLCLDAPAANQENWKEQSERDWQWNR